jgi:endonuclease YncB( thermonuclease family)
MGLTAALLICLAPVAIDGDTVRCGNNLAWTRVRVWGVQAPETGMLGAAEAKAALQRRVNGGIMCEPKGTSYTRIVGLCYDGTGRDVALELLKVDHVVTEWCSYSRNYYGTCVALTPRR